MWFIPFTFRDLIDILLVATILFWIYRSTKGTNAPYIFAGVVVIYFLWIVVRGFNMELLSNILGQFISVGAIALIVIFQPEIRKFLQLLRFRRTHFDILGRLFGAKAAVDDGNISIVVDAVSALSTKHIGGVFVLSQRSDLSLILDGGVSLDARLSKVLLLTLLHQDSELNQGAVVIDGGRIVAARCVLPLSQGELSQHCSMRQKAALGLSEISDAVVITVDAFDGGVSVANSGTLRDDITLENLHATLTEYTSIYKD